MNPNRINESILPGDFCRVTCTRPGYYIQPPLWKLDWQVDSNGNCIVSNFTVGRRNFGKIQFLSPVNVANLNIDEIVFIEHKEVVVYPEEKVKPQLGEGLNCPAEITLERIWPCGKPDELELYNFWQRETDYYYKSKVKDTVVGQGAEFTSYDVMSGVLTFKVNHFSKYSCDLEEDEDDELPPPIGLGGIPLKSLQQEKIGGTGTSDTKASVSSGLVTPSRPVSGPWGDVCDSTVAARLTGDYGKNCENDANVAGKRSGVQQKSSAHACLLPFRPVLQISGSVKSKAMQDVMSVDEFMDEGEFVQPSLPKRARGQNCPLRGDASSGVFSLLPSNMDMDSIEPGRSGKCASEKQMEFTVTNVRNRPVPTLFPKKEVVFATANQPTDMQEDFFSVIKRSLPSVKFSGAPRVCFAPNGSFVTVTNRMTEKGFLGQTNLCQLTSYFDKQDIFPLSGPYRNLLNVQLMLHLKQEGVLFKEHIDVLKDQLKKTSVMSTRMSIQAEIVIWELCDILWPAEMIDVQETTDRGFLLTQRAKLSNWFVKNGQLLFGGKYDQRDHSMFGLLRKGKVEEACEAACEGGNDILAVLIASDPHLHLGFGDDSEELEYFPIRMPEILKLCKGSLKLDELDEDAVGNLNNYDWLQYFALYIWFYGPVKSGIPIGIEKAIREFEEMMRQIIGDEEAPLPKFEDSSVSNLCMHLLKFYSCTGYPLRDILCPRTWSQDCFEYKLSWLLMKNLEHIGYPPDDELYSNVCTSFSSQLENIGLFQWAIFVAGELPPGLEDDDEFGVARAASIKNLHCYRLLERNLHGGDETLDMEKFFIFDLHIDERLIYAVKLEKSYTIGRLDRMMGYLLKMNEFQKAFNVLKSHLTVYGAHLIGNKIPVYTDNLQKYLSALNKVQQRIIGWDTHGKLVLNFIKIIQIRDITIGGSLAEKVLMEFAVVGFLEAVVKFKPSNDIERVLLLEMTMSAQKILELMIVDKDTSEATKDKIRRCLNSFMEIPVPQEYFSGLRAFISNILASF